MRKLLLFILLLASLSAYAQQDNRIIIGTVDTIYSKVLNEKRSIRVHVPEGDKNQRYRYYTFSMAKSIFCRR